MATEHDAQPTVIVSRRFRPGAETNGAEWLERLAQAASEMPGYVDATRQPPSDQHPGDWVIVYRFASADALEGWLSSERRRDLVAEGAELLDGAAREQIVALEQRTVTAVASFRLRPGTRSEFAQRFRELQTVLGTFDGFVDVEVVEPVPGVQDDTVIVFSFTDRERLDRWLASPERADLLDRLDSLIDGDRTVNVVGGFAGWFAHPNAAPKRWKQAALVLLALYPTSLVLAVLRDELYPDLAGFVAILIGNVIGVAILSWLLMPALTRAFDSWLRR